MSFVSLVSHDNGFDLLNFTENFYFAEAVRARLPQLPPRPSVDRARNILNEWDEWIRDIVAPIFKSYIAYAVFGEQRHGAYLKFAHSEKINPSRQECYQEINKYDPLTIYKLTEYMFKVNNNFGGSFGGKKWAQISKAALWFNNTAPSVAIDHCLDLQHNNGSALNKHTGHFNVANWEKYKLALDYKQSSSNVAAEVRDAYIKVEATGYCSNILITIPYPYRPYSPFISLVTDKWLTGRTFDYQNINPIHTAQIPNQKYLSFGNEKPALICKHDDITKVPSELVTVARDQGVPFYILLNASLKNSNVQMVRLV